ITAASLFIPAMFTHQYDASTPIFRVAILATPFAALPLEGTLRACGRTRYIFQINVWKLLVTVPVVLAGIRLFGTIRAIGGYVIADCSVRVAMLARVRRELGAPWADVLPWRQLGG